MIAAITVPWMLVIKPYLLRREHLRNIAAGYATIENESPGTSANAEEAPPVSAAPKGDHGHGEVSRIHILAKANQSCTEI
jgi:hypothetical protein